MATVKLKIARIGNSRGVCLPASKVRLGDKVGSLTKNEAAALRRIITEMYGE